MRVTKVKTVQVYPIPKHRLEAVGPFPPRFLDAPSVKHYAPNQSLDGSEFPLGATVQNNFSPERHLKCIGCGAKVRETEILSHVCEE